MYGGMETPPNSVGPTTPMATGSRPLQTALLGAALAALGFGVQSLDHQPAPLPAPAAAAATAQAPTPQVDTPLPELLSETGLYETGSTTRVRAENMSYVPQ